MLCDVFFMPIQMWNEHFGIGIVEMMAAGLIVVAHNSGGPKSDIVVPLRRSDSNRKPLTTTTGFLATTVEEYADHIYRILTLSDEEAAEIRQNAQESAQRFTDTVFSESFQKVILELILF